MATDSIDDMFNGCRANVASIIDLIGVLEWIFNEKFSSAWSAAEKKAKRPVHLYLKEDHAVVVYIYTQMQHMRQDFDEAVKTGKGKYNTSDFKFHYFYFYLTDTIKILHPSQRSCKTTYHRTWKTFNQTNINTNMRFGAFTWASTSKESLKFNGNVSCFEIYTCFGADITYYSYIKERGQVMIPPYEVFKITHILKNDPWCSVVYRLQSTRIPRRDLNCQLNQNLLNTDFKADPVLQHGSNVWMMSPCVILLLISCIALAIYKHKFFVVTSLGTLLVLIVLFVAAK